VSETSWTFWLLVAALAAAALAFVLPQLARRRAPEPAQSRAALNARIYRAELASLEDERAAGMLSETQHRDAVEELKRRLLAETAAAPARPRASRPARAALAVALALPLAALALYLMLGRPDALQPDLIDAAADISQLAPERMAALDAQLTAQLARAPRDARARVLLARLRFAQDRFGEAAEAYETALAASPKVANDPDVWCEFADALGMAQGGRLSGRPRELIDRALALDAHHPKALELAGSAEIEAGNLTAALRHWQALLERLPPGSAQQRELAVAVERLRRSVPPASR
jgi:cytochrome c-type biogenesis protein CcmH